MGQIWAIWAQPPDLSFGVMLGGCAPGVPTVMLRSISISIMVELFSL
jgi:hypothetical protein